MPQDDVELTDVKHVGPATAETLSEGGFDTVEAVGSADTESLVETVGRWGQDEASEAVETANELLGEGADTPEQKPNDTSAVQTQITTKEALHLLHAVLDEATGQQRSGRPSLAADAYETADYIRQGLPEDTSNTSEMVTLEFPEEADILASLSRVCSQSYRDYQAAPGRVGGMLSTFSQLGDEVDDARY